MLTLHGLSGDDRPAPGGLTDDQLRAIAERVDLWGEQLDGDGDHLPPERVQSMARELLALRTAAREVVAAERETCEAPNADTGWSAAIRLRKAVEALRALVAGKED